VPVAVKIVVFSKKLNKLPTITSSGKRIFNIGWLELLIQRKALSERKLEFMQKVIVIFNFRR
jgi:hypothetical protein